MSQRVAIITDIHANLPALEAALARIEGLSVDQSYCGGDLVGYAPHPNEVCDAMLGAADPAGEDVLVARTGTGFDVAPVDADRRASRGTAVSLPRPRRERRRVGRSWRARSRRAPARRAQAPGRRAGAGEGEHLDHGVLMRRP
jgi:hypothetical protein